jgi:hypothetical protein
MSSYKDRICEICIEVNISNFDIGSLINFNIVTCRVVRVTKITGSSLDDWIY